MVESKVFDIGSEIANYYKKYFYNNEGFLTEEFHYDSNDVRTYHGVYYFNDNDRTYKNYHQYKNNDIDKSIESLCIKYDSIGRTVEKQENPRLYYYIYCDTDNLKSYEKYKHTILDTIKKRNFYSIESNIFNKEGQLIEVYKDRNKKWIDHIQIDTLHGEQKWLAGFPYWTYNSRRTNKYDENGNKTESRLFLMEMRYMKKLFIHMMKKEKILKRKKQMRRGI